MTKHEIKHVTLRDFLAMPICVYIGTDYSDDLLVAFDGPCHITEAGERDLHLEGLYDMTVVVEYENDEPLFAYVEGVYDDTTERMLCHLFYTFAGYASYEDWDNWFKEGNA